MNRKSPTRRPPVPAIKSALAQFQIGVQGRRPVEHAHRIERLLKGAPGVKKADAHLNEDLVTITYDARLTNPAAIHDLLLQRGYKAAEKVD